LRFAFLHFAFCVFLDILVERMAYCGGEVLWVCISKFHIWCKTNKIFHSLSLTKNKSAQTLRHSKNVLYNVWRKLFMYGWCIASEFERPATIKDSQRYGWGSDVSCTCKELLTRGCIHNTSFSSKLTFH
jgi:hypothetical protein